MSTLGLIEYKDASAEVRAVNDDIIATRKTNWINNYGKRSLTIRRCGGEPGKASKKSWRPALSTR